MEPHGSSEQPQPPHRGFVDDEEGGLTAIQKTARLDLIFCTIISRNSIIKGSTSLNHIWQMIREHYGFQSCGSHFHLDLADIRLLPDERPKDLYQQLRAYFEDNLLSNDGTMLHHVEAIETDEDLTPALENTIIFMWLQLINPSLQHLIKQNSMGLSSEIRPCHQSNLRYPKHCPPCSRNCERLRIPGQCVQL